MSSFRGSLLRHDQTAEVEQVKLILSPPSTGAPQAAANSRPFPPDRLPAFFPSPQETAKLAPSPKPRPHSAPASKGAWLPTDASSASIYRGRPDAAPFHLGWLALRELREPGRGPKPTRGWWRSEKRAGPRSWSAASAACLTTAAGGRRAGSGARAAPGSPRAAVTCSAAPASASWRARGGGRRSRARTAAP